MPPPSSWARRVVAAVLLAAAAAARAEPSMLPEHNLALPSLEVAGSNVAVWTFDRYVMRADYSYVDGTTIFRNLQGGWELDRDDFNTNHFLHPYHGSVYFTAARSAGFDFWRSFPFAVTGSLLWKITGENTRPSVNDQITTPVAGAFLGEALFRLSRLVLDRHRRPGLGRWVASAVISPAATFNAAVLDGRIQDNDPPRPTYSGHLSFGAAAGGADTRTGHVGIPLQGRFGFDVTYGLPESVELEAPFDHFEMSLDFSTATAAPWNDLADARGAAWLLAVRGLIAGGATPLGESGRALYGLFGTFDFGGPVLLRVEESGVGPGIVFAARPSAGVALDATLLAAATFGSAGGYAPAAEQRDYHFGAGALVLADARLGLWDRFELHATGRGYLVPAAAAGGDEQLLLGTASLLVRIAGPHAVSLDTSLSYRTADYPGSRYTERSAYVGLSYAQVFGGGRW
jgi:hypothetical protein